MDNFSNGGGVGMTPIFLYETIVGGSGGGGGATVLSNRFNHTITTAFASGSQVITLPVVGSGVQNNSIIVNYQNTPLTAGVDYSIGTNTITLLFADNPANYGGTLNLQIQYIYTA